MEKAVNTDLFIKMVISTWDTQNERVNKFLQSFTDKQLLSRTAPGRNTGLYLLGHLTAVSDGMITILGWGKRLHPELDEPFVKNPDKPGLVNTYSPKQIREFWNEVNSKISSYMREMKQADWFSRHNSVSAEDFAKEPHRNKLNIIINRTNHLSYHVGQLAYLGKKQAD